MKRFPSDKPLDLVAGNITPTLLRFTIPFLLSSVLQSLYGAADVFVVGQFASPAHVSAVSVGSHLMHTLTFIVISLCVGATILIGQFAGAKDFERVSDTIGSLILVALALSVVMTGVVALFCDAILVFMKTPAEAVPHARSYMLICALGLPFVVGYNAVSGILRGLGDSKTPLLFIAVACAVNILFDILLVKGFSMGAAGAAIATSGSQGLSLLFSLLYLKRRGLPFPFSFKKNVRRHPVLVRQIFKLGIPLALQNFLLNISFLVIMIITNSMGVVVSASIGIVDKITSFAMLVPSSTSNAVAAMVAQNIGAKRPDRALASMRSGILFSLAFGTLACIWAQISPQSLIRLFTGDAAVLAAASPYLRAFSLDCIVVAFVFNFNAYFNGCGKPLFTMAHSVATSFFVRIPVSYLFSRMPGATLFEIGLAVPLASFVSMVICLLYLRKNKNTRTA